MDPRQRQRAVLVEHAHDKSLNRFVVLRLRLIRRLPGQAGAVVHVMSHGLRACCGLFCMLLDGEFSSAHVSHDPLRDPEQGTLASCIHGDPHLLRHLAQLAPRRGLESIQHRGMHRGGLHIYDSTIVHFQRQIHGPQRPLPLELPLVPHLSVGPAVLVQPRFKLRGKLHVRAGVALEPRGPEVVGDHDSCNCVHLHGAFRFRRCRWRLFQRRSGRPAAQAQQGSEAQTEAQSRRGRGSRRGGIRERRGRSSLLNVDVDTLRCHNIIKHDLALVQRCLAKSCLQQLQVLRLLLDIVVRSTQQPTSQHLLELLDKHILRPVDGSQGTYDILGAATVGGVHRVRVDRIRPPAVGVLFVVGDVGQVSHLQVLPGHGLSSNSAQQLQLTALLIREHGHHNTHCVLPFPQVLLDGGAGGLQHHPVAVHVLQCSDGFDVHIDHTVGCSP
mmetsp:Transcript_86508/g.231876  ORF Transcript_86508/g.231876 Transcript_86508/m.231876 type:complete len:442 (-) Transcript_86508:1062-2387(-)